MTFSSIILRQDCQSWVSQNVREYHKTSTLIWISKSTVRITDLETEQHCPPATQAAVQTEEKPLKAELSKPCAKTVESEPSNGDAVTYNTGY